MKKIFLVIPIVFVASSLTWGSKTQIDTTGLVAWYPFSWNANDFSGHGHHGTVYGATLTADRYGNPNSAYLFDGINDYIQVPYSVELNPPKRMTVSSWVKADSWGSLSYSNYVLGTEQSGNKGYSLRGGATTATFMIGSGGAWWPAETASGAIASDRWYHLTGVYDGTAVRLYINGVEMVTTACYDTITPATIELIIGTSPGSFLRYFDGVIDDIRIYSRALSASEIVDLYHEYPAPAQISPVNNQLVNSHDVSLLWHSLDTASSYQAQVSSDSNFSIKEFDQVIAAPDTGVNVAGLIYDNYFWRVRAYIPSDSTLWSSAAKFRIDTIPPLPPVLIFPADEATTTDSLVHFHWDALDSGFLYNIVVSYDSFCLVVADSATIDSCGYISSMGLIDSIYYWKVRACDLAANWSGYSAPRKFILNTFTPVLITPVNGSLVPSYLQTFDWKDSRNAVGYFLVISYDSLFASLSDSVTTLVSEYISEDSLPDSIFYWRVRAYRGMADTSDWSEIWHFTVHSRLLDSLVAWYPFSWNANDFSGHGHHGTVYGATLTADRYGNPNSAYLFDGINDYIQVPYSVELNPPKRMTVSSWVKADSWGSLSYSNYVLGTEQSGNKGYSLRGGATTATFMIGSGGAWWPAETASGAIASDRWYHLTGVYDGTAVRLYINGVEMVTTACYDTITPATIELIIGTSPGSFLRYFDGVIDDIRIYSRALDSCEIDFLYHEGGYTGIEERPEKPFLPQSVILSLPHPNPARETAEIDYQLPVAAPVMIELYNVTGQKVVTLTSGKKNAGWHQVTWNLHGGNGHRLPNGIYMIRLTAGALKATGKIVVLR